VTPRQILALLGLLALAVFAAAALVEEWRRYRARTMRARALAAANAGSRRQRWRRR
jgi:hypothetical protein